MYAVGGEVKIDTSPERTPEATVSKMQQVRRAALAPADPSGTDRAVAAEAAQAEAHTRAEQSAQAAASPTKTKIALSKMEMPPPHIAIPLLPHFWKAHLTGSATRL